MTMLFHCTCASMATNDPGPTHEKGCPKYRPTRESDEEIAARVVRTHLEAHGSTADTTATNVRATLEQLCLSAITEARKAEPTI